MKSETNDIREVFEERRQYRVPFYQRAYVWGKEEQWEPLWNDAREKADARTAGETPSPHFLGAIVLEPQKRRGLRGVEAFHIIDGQQRLTTLQYFLAALLMTVREDGPSAIQTLLQGCLWNANPETMERPDIERFKVWPTFRDREPYQGAMEAANRDELRTRFPSSFTRDGSFRKIGVDHPAALEAVWFFRDQIDNWLTSEKINGEERARRLEGLTEAVLRDLKLVSIALDEDDDAQVIFETLNGRGAELHATDLIRNFIFMRADREDADGPNLYDSLWSPFETSFWTEEQRRGRLRRPRLEWFVQTALQAELADNAEIGRLYAEYRRYSMGQKTPMPAVDQLRMLTRYADQYRQFLAGAGTEPVSRFGKRIAVWDASPTHALALRVACLGWPAEEQTRVFDDIVSYIVRRAVCGLTPKNYNNVFLQLLKGLTGDGATAAAFHAALSDLKGNSSRWPTGDEFRRAWLSEPAHKNLGEPARIREVLTELENHLRSERSEEPYVANLGTLDVDHILPDRWQEHWPLAGEPVTAEDISNAFLASITSDKENLRVQAINRRERLKATLGNLTLVHYGVNRFTTEWSVLGETRAAVRGIKSASESHTDACYGLG
jgi:hypothetical protein